MERQGTTLYNGKPGMNHRIISRHNTNAVSYCGKVFGTNQLSEELRPADCGICFPLRQIKPR